MIKITIDDIELDALEGDYILNIARENGIFIPALCYLSGCQPTLACKLCMVEIEGKRHYACNTKAKDGMKIATNSPQIAAERYAIMQSYAVNHPLECGVCDKSGECELQDFVAHFGVDSQDFFVPDSPKNFAFWSQVKYDPSLCILCERCVTTCKDNLGFANLKAQKCEAPSIEHAKEAMPKDAFSVWNRRQKATIAFVGESECADCAECVSVCPVGALGVKSFQYRANAWELRQTSSTCALCAAGCKIIYESKRDKDGCERIYRVTNDANFNPICGAGRFAFDVGGGIGGASSGGVGLSSTAKCGGEGGHCGGESSGESLQTAQRFSEALERLKSAKIIAVGGNVTNNEARFLAALARKFGTCLVNPTLKKYSEFLDVFLAFGGALSGLENIAAHRVFVAFGSALKEENPLTFYKINNALKMQKDSHLVYAHALVDKLVARLSKNITQIALPPSFEDIFLLGILRILEPKSALLEPLNATQKTAEIRKIVEEKATDENGAESVKKIEKIEQIPYFGVLEEAGIDVATFENLANILGRAKPLIIVGGDILEHPNANYAAKILAYLQGANLAAVLLVPPSANANGICAALDFCDGGEGDFDCGCGENAANLGESAACVGFRAEGKFVIDSVCADFKIPHFENLNDTITNIDCRELPLNAVFGGENYLENWAANLGLEVDFAPQDLANDYGQNGADLRGRTLRIYAKNAPKEADFVEFSRQKTAPNAPNAYLRDPQAHFYPYTRFSQNLQGKVGIYASREAVERLNAERGVSEGDFVLLSTENGANGAKLLSPENPPNPATPKNPATPVNLVNLANAANPLNPADPVPPANPMNPAPRAAATIRAQIFIDPNLGGEIFAVSPQIEGALALFGGKKFARVTLKKAPQDSLGNHSQLKNPPRISPDSPPQDSKIAPDSKDSPPNAPDSPPKAPPSALGAGCTDSHQDCHDKN